MAHVQLTLEEDVLKELMLRSIPRLNEELRRTEWVVPEAPSH
jgi:hypothetical protein